MIYSDEIIRLVWEKARIIDGFDPDQNRRDIFGVLILRTEYGSRLTAFGWEIDRIDPNGGYDVDNLQPLQWKNFVAKGEE